MTIKTKLTLKNTSVTAIVFLLCMVMIYFVSDHTRSSAFLHDLRSQAVTKANLYLENQVDAATMRSILLKNKNFINEVEVAIYTSDFKLLYHDAVDNDIVKEDQKMIDDILKKNEITFSVGKYEGIGIKYNFKGTDYIVTAAAYDSYGKNNQKELLKDLCVLFIIGLTLLFIACYFLARSSLTPIREIVKEANAITANEIGQRLPVQNERDELGELAIAFNDLLERLEQSFTSQKSFVGNVSHELRTPLAALTAELDLSLSKNRTEEQYRNAMQNALQDARRMTRLIDGLLNLAKADYQKEQIKMEAIRLDELLIDAREQILRGHPHYHIDILFEQEAAEDDRLITVNGNIYLLTIAFSNLIENNCKYSADNTSFVQISYWDKWTIVRMSDDGIGMSETDKQNLFTLFYRGEQEHKVEGHGIGMALSHKIISLHHGDIAVHSEQGKGTTFVVELPHI
ncbi:MAG: ATP-binding protein [Prevotella sp.]|nr:ATP-binding protein [Prevotella sp.]